jgi:hypothetical protein
VHLNTEGEGLVEQQGRFEKGIDSAGTTHGVAARNAAEMGQTD